MLRRIFVRSLACLAVAPLLVAVASPAQAEVATFSLHSATFSGRYVADPRVTNWASSCFDGGIRVAVNTCALWFKTPSSYKHMCSANPASRATVGYWAPNASDMSKYVGVDLYWTGGGVLEGTVVYPGIPAAYTMHIELVDACGDAPAAIDPITINSVNGDDVTIDAAAMVAPHYTFTGHLDAV